MEGRVEELLTRGVDALEKMASDPIVEYEAGPPICPHCGEYDPVITSSASDEMSGHLSEVVIMGTCRNCGHTLYAVVESYSMHRDRDSALLEMTERKERAGNAEDGERSQS